MIPYWWPAIVFGAPGLIASLVVSGVGIHLGKPMLLRIGAILALPSAYYIGGIPGWWPAFFLPAFHLIAAMAITRSRRLLAVCLLLPNAAAAIALTAVTLANQSRVPSR